MQSITINYINLSNIFSYVYEWGVVKPSRYPPPNVDKGNVDPDDRFTNKS